jgi:hypothetical protein
MAIILELPNPKCRPLDNELISPHNEAKALGTIEATATIHRISASHGFEAEQVEQYIARINVDGTPKKENDLELSNYLRLLRKRPKVSGRPDSAPESRRSAASEKSPCKVYHLDFATIEKRIAKSPHRNRSDGTASGNVLNTGLFGKK